MSVLFTPNSFTFLLRSFPPRCFVSNKTHLPHVRLSGTIRRSPSSVLKDRHSVTSSVVDAVLSVIDIYNFVF